MRMELASYSSGRKKGEQTSNWRDRTDKEAEERSGKLRKTRIRKGQEHTRVGETMQVASIYSGRGRNAKRVNGRTEGTKYQEKEQELEGNEMVNEHDWKRKGMRMLVARNPSLDDERESKQVSGKAEKTEVKRGKRETRVEGRAGTEE